MLILTLVAFITYSYKQFDEGVKTPLTLLFIPKVVYKDAKSSFQDMKETFKVKRPIKTRFVEINSPTAKKQKEILFPMLELTDMQDTKEDHDSFSLEFLDAIEIIEDYFPSSGATKAEETRDEEMEEEYIPEMKTAVKMSFK